MRVGITVVDPDGRLVTDLEPEDFELLEDGHRQEVRYFSRSLAGDAHTIPLHLRVFLDASSSMERDGRFVKTAVINKRAGGMGLISGRKAFQRERSEGIRLLNTIQDVYLDDAVTVA